MAIKIILDNICHIVKMDNVFRPMPLKRARMRQDAISLFFDRRYLFCDSRASRRGSVRRCPVVLPAQDGVSILLGIAKWFIKLLHFLVAYLLLCVIL